MDLLGGVDDLGGGDDVAQAPAGDGIGLGQGRAGQGPLPHAGQRRKVHMLVRLVDDVLVHLVGDHIGVVSFGQLRDKQQLLPGEHLAAGVGGIAEDQGLRVLPEGRLQLLGLEVKLRGVQGHIDRFRAGKDHVRAVVFIERGENDELVPRVGDGHHRGHHGLGAAAGDDDLAVGIDVDAHEAALLFGQRGAQIVGAPGDGILVEVLVPPAPAA